MSIGRIRAEYYIIFALGVFFLAWGTYGTYNAAIELMAGIQTRLILAAIASVILGFIMVGFSYQIFFPLKKDNYNPERVCPFCSAIVEEDATICEKCKQQLE